jgi:hypothetical protein
VHGRVDEDVHAFVTVERSQRFREVRAGNALQQPLLTFDDSRLASAAPCCGGDLESDESAADDDDA